MVERHLEHFDQRLMVLALHSSGIAHYQSAFDLGRKNPKKSCHFIVRPGKDKQARFNLETGEPIKSGGKSRREIQERMQG